MDNYFLPHCIFLQYTRQVVHHASDLQESLQVRVQGPLTLTHKTLHGVLSISFCQVILLKDLEGKPLSVKRPENLVYLP